MGDLRFVFYFLNLQQSLKLSRREIPGYDVTMKWKALFCVLKEKKNQVGVRWNSTVCVLPKAMNRDMEKRA